MTEDLFRRVTLYQTTMSVFIKLKEQGLISTEEFVDIDIKMAAKYDLESSVIYRGTA